MFNVMIIDDEMYIRESIKRMIQWDQLGLKLVCEAADSDSAWELFTTYRPMIVITDISIPYISGLELARKIADEAPDAQFIVITGYPDFENVRKSVKLGAIDLISKPVMTEEINASLKRACDVLRTRISEQRRQEKLSAMMNESRYMLTDAHYSRLLTSADAQERKRLCRNLAIFHNRSASSRCAVAILSLLNHDADNSDIVMIAAKNLAEKLLLKAGFSSYVYFSDYSDLICVLCWPEDSRTYDISKVFVQFDERMRFYFDTASLSGIGVSVPDPSELYRSYQTAKRALVFARANRGDTVTNYQDIQQLCASPERNVPKPPTIKELSACLQGEEPDALLQRIDAQLSSFFATKPAQLSRAQEYSLTYAIHLCASYTALSDCSMMGSCTKYFASISAANTQAALHSAIHDMTRSISSALLERQYYNSNRLISIATDYIRENMNDCTLSLEQVSEYIGFSSTYFCRLFHREVGQSFSEYLNAVRIDYSKQLLRNPRLKISEISSMAGYNTPTHFNYVFKRLVGMTPSEFKHLNPERQEP